MTARNINYELKLQLRIEFSFIGLSNSKMGAENQFVLFKMYISPPMLPPYAISPLVAAPQITDTLKNKFARHTCALA